MKQRRVSIREDQHQFLQDQTALSLAPLLRDALDELINGERDMPHGGRRKDVDVVKTTVLLRESQYDFLKQNDMNFSAFVSQVIDERMELQRQLSELDE